MKKIKNLIILCIFLIVVLIGTIVLVRMKQKDPEVIIQDKEKMGVGEFTEEKLEEVNLVEGLQVDLAINQYLSISNKNSSAYYGKNDNNENQKMVEERDIKNNIYQLLSENYIEKNKLTVENIYDSLEEIEENQRFTILEIKKIYHKDSVQFITKGFIEENETFKGEKIFIVNFNTKESVYSIEPIEDSIAEIEEVEAPEVIIEKNENNSIPKVLANAENLAKKYFDILKRMMLIYPEKAYQYLDEEYREKRFSNSEEFKEFISKNKEELEKSLLEKFQMNNENDKTQYVLVNQFNNTYIINATSFMNYRVKLDTYTIITDKFKQEYDKAKEQKKVMMNVDKWVQMLNNRDYKAAYNVLDETFRNNNFATEEQFEAFMRQNCPLHYEVEYGEFTQENNTCTQEIRLKDITEENSNFIQTTIIMQLKEDYNFVMSFGME